MGILGSQFLEPSEEQPLALDRQQWVRNLEWRPLVPDDRDRRRVEQRMSFDPQHGVVGLRHAGRLLLLKSEPHRDRPLQPALRLPVRREFRQLLQWARQVNQEGFAGVVQQAPEGVLGQTELADVDGVLGDRVELRGVAAKPTLVSEGVGDILDQNVAGIRKQRPKPQAGEGVDEAVEAIHTEKWNTARGSAQFPGEARGAPAWARARALAAEDTGPANFPTPGEKTTKRSEVVRALETKFLLFWAGHKQDNCPAAVTDTSLSTAGVSHFAKPNRYTGSAASNLAGPGLGASGSLPDCRFPSTRHRRRSAARAPRPVRLPRSLRLQAPSPPAAGWFVADAPGPPKHRVAPRGERRSRRNASRLRSGTPTGCGRLPRDPGGGCGVGHCPCNSIEEI